MEKVANQLTDYLIRTNTVQEEEKEIYAYGFQVGLELVAVLLIIVVSAGILRMPLECGILLSVFFIIRSFAGGIHMNSFLSCFFCSEVLMVVSMLTIKYVVLSIYAVAGISILSLVIIKLLSPVENDNRPVCDWEREVFAKRLNITIAILIVLESILFISNNSYLLWNVTVGEILMMLALVWGKMKYRKTR